MAKPPAKYVPLAPQVYAYLHDVAGPSLKKNLWDQPLAGLGNAAIHPIQTAQGLGGLAAAIDSRYLQGIIRANRLQINPAEVARTEAPLHALANQIEAPFTSVDPATRTRHFSTSALQHTLATDPGVLAADAAPFVPGLGELAEGAGLARTAKVLKVAGDVANPLVGGSKIALKIAKKVTGGAGNAGVHVLSGLSRQSPTLVQAAVDAGRSPAGRAAYATAQQTGDAQGLAKKLSDAISANRASQIAALDAGKNAVSGLPVDMGPVNSALEKINSDAAMGAGTTLWSPARKDVLSRINDAIAKINADPSLQTVKHLGNVKDDLWKLKFEGGGAAADMAGEMGNGVSSALRSTAGGGDAYANLMDASQLGQEEVRGLIADTGGKAKSSAASVAKTLRSIGTPAGGNLLDNLSTYDPTIGPSLAGYTSKQLLPNGMATIQDIGAALLAGRASLMHHPIMAAAGAPFMALSSPRVALGTAKLAGQVGAFTKPVLDAVGSAAAPVLDAVGSAAAPVLGGAAPYVAARGAGLAQEAEHPEHPDLVEDTVYLPDLAAKPAMSEEAASAGDHDTSVPVSEDIPLPDLAARPTMQDDTQPDPSAQAAGGRIMRASGGSVGSVGPLVDALMSRAKSAKRATDATTKPLLNAPDGAIVHALGVAQEAI